MNITKHDKCDGYGGKENHDHHVLIYIKNKQIQSFCHTDVSIR